MDRLLVAASFIVPLTVALAWAIWYLVAQGRRDRRASVPTSHAFRGQGEAVTVAELVDDTIEYGEGVRLNWTADDEAQAGPWRGIRPYAQDQVGTEVIGKGFGSGGDFQTEILPKVEDDDER